MTEGVFYFNVSSLGKDSPNQFTVTAIDCNGIASVTQAVGTWPVVLITAPMDKNLGKNVNPYTYSVTNSAANPIRALVLTPAQSTSAVPHRPGGSWYLMQRTSGTNQLSSLLGGLMECLRPGSREHTIEVQASTASGVRTDTVKVNMQATVPQPTAKVVRLATGKYVKRTTNLNETAQFVPGDSIVFRATIHNANGQPVANATASIAVTGPQAKTILTGPSDANGIADGIWKTSPHRENQPAPHRDLHGHGQRCHGKRPCLGCVTDVRTVHNNSEIIRQSTVLQILFPRAKGGLRGFLSGSRRAASLPPP
jgi:hypothetical protein